MRPHHLEKLFNPESIAVFGVNNKLESVGTRVFSNLIQAGFKGKLFPVNPHYETVQEHTCYTSLAKINNPVELAIIATPAASVIEIVRDCGEHGVGAAVILTAGFRESGDKGKRLEQELIDTARHYDIRLLGPNCLGLMRPSIGLDATFLNTPAADGRLALVSQSGALCTAILDWAKPHNLGFSTVVSLGNATDIDFGDVLDYLAIDAKTDAILLYIEGVQDARAFMSGLRSAAHSKPVIVLKVGRHDRGSQAARTHTGAMVGADDIFDAALERAGVVRATTFGHLFAAAEILSTGIRVSGNRLAIVTNGGGPGVLATDRAEDLGVEIAQLSTDTIQALDKILPSHWSRGNPVDILGDAPPAKYGEAISACLDDDNVDGILTILTPQAMSRPLEAAQSVIDIVETSDKTPVLACWMGATQVEDARELFVSHSLPSFYTPERAVEAFSYLSRYQQNQQLLLQTPGPLSDIKEPDIEGARLIIQAALADGREMLSDTESKAILNAFHIRCTQTIETRSANEALIAAESLGFPVAMKISSPDISHKTDVDGVRTNVMSAADVRKSFKSITDNVLKIKPNADIRGVTVEPMIVASDARELMVGVTWDPVFGPVIAFGAGGVMAEILNDSKFALPPLNRTLAKKLIESTRVSKLLGAYRQMTEIKNEDIEDVLLRVSEMVCELPHIQEMDINPLFADSHGVFVADARILVKRPSISLLPYSHMAIHPYPSHLLKQTHLADGTNVTIRPIRPEDADIEKTFVHELSPQSKYYRFMHAVNELTPKMLAYFTQIDYSREMAIIAVTDDDDKQTQIGVARYIVNPDGNSCEFALVVSDQYPSQGLGSRLMEAIMEAARSYGIRIMEGEVLADNHRMLSLVKRLGFSIMTSESDPNIRNVERHL